MLSQIYFFLLDGQQVSVRRLIINSDQRLKVASVDGDTQTCDIVEVVVDSTKPKMFPGTVVRKQGTVQRVIKATDAVATAPVQRVTKVTAAVGTVPAAGTAQVPQYVPNRNISITKALAERNKPTAAIATKSSHEPGTRNPQQLLQLKQFFNKSVTGNT